MTVILTPPERELLRQIFQSPRLPQLRAAIDSHDDEEKRLRQQFYAEITPSDKAEFINGEIVWHSPVRLWHNVATGNLLTLLKSHVHRHQLGLVGFEKILVSLTRNDYEPDVCFFGNPRAEEFAPDQMRFPAPDFVAEVLSPRTAQNDRGIKFTDYAAHGVREYWIIDPEARTLEQYENIEGEFSLRIKSGTGDVTSVAVEGFSIPIQAIFDDAINQQTLRRLLGVSA